MKPFGFCKLSVVLLGLGGVLILAPQSRAQSEIAPDHFDGADSWAAAASAKVHAAKVKPHSAIATSEARNSKPAVPALEPVAARDLAALRRSDALAANKKRKTAAGKPND